MKKITKKNIMKLLMKDDPCITAPMIDKLSAVVDLKDAELFGLAWNTLIQWQKDPTEIVSKAAGSGKFPIARKIHYPVGNEPLSVTSPFILMQLTSAKAFKLQARLEWNPAYITEVAEAYLDGQFLEAFGMGFYEFLYHARFTRVDWCRDILLRDIEDYLFRASWTKVSQCFFSSAGKLETMYLGKGNLEFKVYDKAKELYGSKAEQSRIRIEVKCKINLTIHELATMENPFDRIEVISVACNNPPYGTAHMRAFQDSCRLRDITNAIKRQPADHRAKLKKWLKDLQVWWWPIAADDWEWLRTSALENAGLTQIPDSAPSLNLEELTGKAA